MTRFTLVFPLLVGSMLFAHADNTHRHRDHGISISINNGKVDIDGVQGLVDGELDKALEALDDMKGMPDDVRAKLRQRLGKLRGSLDKRLRHLDLDNLDSDLDKMGEEIGKQMEQFGSDMDQWGRDFGKKMEHQFGQAWQRQWHHMSPPQPPQPPQPPGVHGWDDNDDDNQDMTMSDDDDHDSVDDDAVKDLGDLSLRPDQREQIARLRSDTDRQVASAKAALEADSKVLRAALDNPSASDAEISRAIDNIAQQEAAIRKARVLAWHSARRMLDDGQRSRVEAAAKKVK